MIRLLQKSVSLFLCAALLLDPTTVYAMDKAAAANTSVELALQENLRPDSGNFWQKLGFRSRRGPLTGDQNLVSAYRGAGVSGRNAAVPPAQELSLAQSEARMLTTEASALEEYLSGSGPRGNGKEARRFSSEEAARLAGRLGRDFLTGGDAAIGEKLIPPAINLLQGRIDLPQAARQTLQGLLSEKPAEMLRQKILPILVLAEMTKGFSENGKPALHPGEERKVVDYLRTRAKDPYDQEKLNSLDHTPLMLGAWELFSKALLDKRLSVEAVVFSANRDEPHDKVIVRLDGVGPLDPDHFEVTVTSSMNSNETVQRAKLVKRDDTHGSYWFEVKNLLPSGKQEISASVRARIGYHHELPKTLSAGPVKVDLPRNYMGSEQWNLRVTLGPDPDVHQKIAWAGRDLLSQMTVLGAFITTGDLAGNDLLSGKLLGEIELSHLQNVNETTRHFLVNFPRHAPADPVHLILEQTRALNPSSAEREEILKVSNFHGRTRFVAEEGKDLLIYTLKLPDSAAQSEVRILETRFRRLNEFKGTHPFIWQKRDDRVLNFHARDLIVPSGHTDGMLFTLMSGSREVGHYLVLDMRRDSLEQNHWLIQPTIFEWWLNDRGLQQPVKKGKWLGQKKSEESYGPLRFHFNFPQRGQTRSIDAFDVSVKITDSTGYDSVQLRRVPARMVNAIRKQSRDAGGVLITHEQEASLFGRSEARQATVETYKIKNERSENQTVTRLVLDKDNWVAVSNIGGKPVDYVSNGEQVLYHTKNGTVRGPDGLATRGGGDNMAPWGFRIPGAKFTDMKGQEIDLQAELELKPYLRLVDGESGTKNALHGLLPHLLWTVETGTDEQGPYIRATVKTTDFPAIARIFGPVQETVTYRIQAGKLSAEKEFKHLGKPDKDEDVYWWDSTHFWFRLPKRIQWKIIKTSALKYWPADPQFQVHSGSAQWIESGTPQDLFSKPLLDRNIETAFTDLQMENDPETELVLSQAAVQNTETGEELWLFHDSPTLVVWNPEKEEFKKENIFAFEPGMRGNPYERDGGGLIAPAYVIPPGGSVRRYWRLERRVRSDTPIPPRPIQDFWGQPVVDGKWTQPPDTTETLPLRSESRIEVQAQDRQIVKHLAELALLNMSFMAPQAAREKEALKRAGVKLKKRTLVQEAAGRAQGQIEIILSGIPRVSKPPKIYRDFFAADEILNLLHQKRRLYARAAGFYFRGLDARGLIRETYEKNRDKSGVEQSEQWKVAAPFSEEMAEGFLQEASDALAFGKKSFRGSLDSFNSGVKEPFSRLQQKLRELKGHILKDLKDLKIERLPVIEFAEREMDLLLNPQVDTADIPEALERLDADLIEILGFEFAFTKAQEGEPRFDWDVIFRRHLEELDTLYEQEFKRITKKFLVRASKRSEARVVAKPKPQPAELIAVSTLNAKFGTQYRGIGEGITAWLYDPSGQIYAHLDSLRSEARMDLTVAGEHSFSETHPLIWKNDPALPAKSLQLDLTPRDFGGFGVIRTNEGVLLVLKKGSETKHLYLLLAEVDRDRKFRYPNRFHSLKILESPPDIEHPKAGLGTHFEGGDLDVKGLGSHFGELEIEFSSDPVKMKISGLKPERPILSEGWDTLEVRKLGSFFSKKLWKKVEGEANRRTLVIDPGSKLAAQSEAPPSLSVQAPTGLIVIKLSRAQTGMAFSTGAFYRGEDQVAVNITKAGAQETFFLIAEFSDQKGVKIFTRGQWDILWTEHEVSIDSKVTLWGSIYDIKKYSGGSKEVTVELVPQQLRSEARVAGALAEDPLTVFTFRPVLRADHVISVPHIETDAEGEGSSPYAKVVVNQGGQIVQGVHGGRVVKGGTNVLEVFRKQGERIDFAEESLEVVSVDPRTGAVKLQPLAKSEAPSARAELRTPRVSPAPARSEVRTPLQAAEEKAVVFEDPALEAEFNAAFPGVLLSLSKVLAEAGTKGIAYVEKGSPVLMIITDQAWPERRYAEAVYEDDYSPGMHPRQKMVSPAVNEQGLKNKVGKALESVGTLNFNLAGGSQAISVQFSRNVKPQSGKAIGVMVVSANPSVYRIRAKAPRSESRTTESSPPSENLNPPASDLLNQVALLLTLNAVVLAVNTLAKEVAAENLSKLGGRNGFKRFRIWIEEMAFGVQLLFLTAAVAALVTGITAWEQIRPTFERLRDRLGYNDVAPGDQPSRSEARSTSPLSGLRSGRRTELQSKSEARTLKDTLDGEGWAPVVQSERNHEGLTFLMARKKESGEIVLVVADNGREENFHKADPFFDWGEINLAPGEPSWGVAEFSHKNAQALRELFPWTAPRISRQDENSFGAGNRNHSGLGTAEQVAAAVEMGIAANGNQSVREYNYIEGHGNDRNEEELTSDFQRLVDNTTWGAFTAGAKDVPIGVDGDHLRDEMEVRAAAKAGVSTFTFDPTAVLKKEGLIKDAEGKNIAVQSLTGADLDKAFGAFRDRNEAAQTEIDRLLVEYSSRAGFDEQEAKRILITYYRTIQYVETLYRTAKAHSGGWTFNVELAADEVPEIVTTPQALRFIAEQLKKKGVPLNLLAPRPLGRWEKGIDLFFEERGDAGRQPGKMAEFEAHLESLAEVAKEFGIKLSIHTGSDKWSGYAVLKKLITEKGFKFHLKTSGTSYLAQLKVVARYAPELFKEILTNVVTRDRFETVLKSYPVVTTNFDELPTADALAGMNGEALEKLFDPQTGNSHLIQILHYLYAYVLNERGEQINEVLRQHPEAHEAAVKGNLIRHMTAAGLAAPSEVGTKILGLGEKQVFRNGASFSVDDMWVVYRGADSRGYANVTLFDQTGASLGVKEGLRAGSSFQLGGFEIKVTGIGKMGKGMVFWYTVSPSDASATPSKPSAALSKDKGPRLLSSALVWIRRLGSPLWTSGNTDEQRAYSFAETALLHIHPGKDIAQMTGEAEDAVRWKNLDPSVEAKTFEVIVQAFQYAQSAETFLPARNQLVEKIRFWQAGPYLGGTPADQLVANIQTAVFGADYHPSLRPILNWDSLQQQVFRPVYDAASGRYIPVWIGQFGGSVEDSLYVVNAQTGRILHRDHSHAVSSGGRFQFDLVENLLLVLNAGALKIFEVSVQGVELVPLSGSIDMESYQVRNEKDEKLPLPAAGKISENVIQGVHSFGITVRTAEDASNVLVIHDADEPKNPARNSYLDLSALADTSRSEVRTGSVANLGKFTHYGNDLKDAVDLSGLSLKEQAEQVAASGAETIIVRDHKIDRTFLDQVPAVKNIIRFGHGLDGIDLAYALKKGIKVYRTRGNEKPVAALMVRMLGRAIQLKEEFTESEDQVPPSLLTIPDFDPALERRFEKSGITGDEKDFLKRKAAEVLQPIGPRTLEALKGKTLGIIGFGVLGQELARFAEAQGMKIMVNTQTPEESAKGGEDSGYPVADWKEDVLAAQRSGYSVSTKEEIYQTADFIVLATGLYMDGPFKNVGLVDREAVKHMLGNKNLIALLNVDRWELVDHAAVEELLKNSGVQYFSDAALKPPFLREHARFTPHIPGLTDQAEKGAWDNLVRLLPQVIARSDPKAFQDWAGDSSPLEVGLKQMLSVRDAGGHLFTFRLEWHQDKEGFVGVFEKEDDKRKVDLMGGDSPAELGEWFSIFDPDDAPLQTGSEIEFGFGGDGHPSRLKIKILKLTPEGDAEFELKASSADSVLVTRVPYDSQGSGEHKDVLLVSRQAQEIKLPEGSSAPDETAGRIRQKKWQVFSVLPQEVNEAVLPPILESAGFTADYAKRLAGNLVSSNSKSEILVNNHVLRVSEGGGSKTADVLVFPVRRDDLVDLYFIQPGGEPLSGETMLDYQQLLAAQIAGMGGFQSVPVGQIYSRQLRGIKWDFYPEASGLLQISGRRRSEARSLRTLMAGLYGDTAERIQAIKQNLPSSDETSGLSEALMKSGSEPEQTDILLILSQMGVIAREAVPAILSKLSEGPPRVQPFAAFALGNIGYATHNTDWISALQKAADSTGARESGLQAYALQAVEKIQRRSEARVAKTLSQSERVKAAGALMPSTGSALVVADPLWLPAAREIWRGNIIAGIAQNKSEAQAIQALNRRLGPGQSPILLAESPEQAVNLVRTELLKMGIRQGSPRAEIRAIVSDGLSLTALALKRELGDGNVTLGTPRMFQNAVKATGVERMVRWMRAELRTSSSA